VTGAGAGAGFDPVFVEHSRLDAATLARHLNERGPGHGAGFKKYRQSDYPFWANSANLDRRAVLHLLDQRGDSSFKKVDEVDWSVALVQDLLEGEPNAAEVRREDLVFITWQCGQQPIPVKRFSRVVVHFHPAIKNALLGG